jgi:hypothetical protein
MRVGGTHHGLWQQHRDATDRMNAVLDPDSEPAAVNCRQRRARHHRQKAFPLVIRRFHIGEHAGKHGLATVLPSTAAVNVEFSSEGAVLRDGSFAFHRPAGRR